VAEWRIGPGVLLDKLRRRLGVDWFEPVPRTDLSSLIIVMCVEPVIIVRRWEVALSWFEGRTLDQERGEARFVLARPVESSSSPPSRLPLPRWFHPPSDSPTRIHTPFPLVLRNMSHLFRRENKPPQVDLVEPSQARAGPRYE